MRSEQNSSSVTNENILFPKWNKITVIIKEMELTRIKLELEYKIPIYLSSLINFSQF